MDISISRISTPEATGRHGVDVGSLALVQVSMKNRLKKVPWWNRECMLSSREGLFPGHLYGSGTDLFSVVIKSLLVQNLISLSVE